MHLLSVLAANVIAQCPEADPNLHTRFHPIAHETFMTFLDTTLAKVSPLKVFRILLVEGLHLGLLLRFVVVRRRTLVESLIGVARVGWGIRLSRHVVTVFVVAQLVVVVVVWLGLRLMGCEWCNVRGEGDVGGALALDGAGGFGVVRRSCLGSVGHGR